MSKVSKPSEDCLTGLKKMFPCPWEISLCKKILDDPKTSISSLGRMGDSQQSLTSLSRKPVCCPYFSCNKTIAVTTFYDHFRYEHPSVTFLDTKFEIRNGLNFRLEDIHYNERHCILLINILNDKQQNKCTSKIAESRGVIASLKPALLVMAIRIHCFDSLDERDNFSSGDADDDSSSIYDPHACTPDDRILIWIASNIATKYSYTLAVSTLCNEIRLKYFGPMLTFNEDPLKMCSEGRGLILSNFHMKGMTENGTKPLVMDIIIHDTIENDEGISDTCSCPEECASSEEIIDFY
ncbi:uncharacterized protein LOC108735006 isoform X2 [Agrilus planipennis]|nr:uncharacterized protein LOC108735006 isoform X2 [Agrilus planipennis]